MAATQANTPSAAGPETGGGFGLNARPLGACVIQKGQLRCKRAIDLSRMLLYVLAALGTTVLIRRRRG